MSVSTSQPSSPQEFINAGATPEQAAILHEQHETMCGRRGSDARVAMSVAAQEQPPAPKAGPVVARTVTQAEATAALEAHTESQFSGHLDRAFAPPASPSEYQFPATRVALTDEQLAADTALKGALHAEGMPRFVVENIAKTLSQSSHAIARETPAEAEARIGANKARLTALWGGESAFNTNIRAVDAMLEQMGNKSPALRELISSGLAGRLTPLDVDLLLQVAKHRAGRL
jgi:hypothetical protein